MHLFNFTSLFIYSFLCRSHTGVVGMARGQGLISWNMTHGVNTSNVHIIIRNMCTMRHNASLFFLQICRNIVCPLLFILNDSYFANTNTKEGWKGKFGLLSGVYIPLLWKPRYQPHKYRSDGIFFKNVTFWAIKTYKMLMESKVHPHKQEEYLIWFKQLWPQETLVKGWFEHRQTQTQLKAMIKHYR